MDPIEQRLSAIERMVDDIQTVVHKIQKTHAEEHQLDDVMGKLRDIERAVARIG